MLPWPLPALLTWAFAWAVFALLSAVAAPPIVALACAAVVGALPAVLSPWPLTRWRRLFIALGFPLSLALSGSAHDVPAWAWLLPLTVLALLYPLNAWRDAPFFPTPRGALEGLQRLVPLPDAARVLEAGCGLGDGLRELHAEYPTARIEGIEWSWPLRWACQRRAVAGKNAHINRDLSFCLTQVWSELGAAPEAGTPMQRDFERVNLILAETEPMAKDKLFEGWLRDLEELAGEFDDLMALWSIDKARDLAWTNGQAQWALRSAPAMRDRVLAGTDKMAGFFGSLILGA